MYNADTMEQCTYNDNTHRLVRRTAGYYNGDNMGVSFQNDYYSNGGNYVWKARIFEPINMINGQFPTNLVTSGVIQTAPIISTTVQTFPTSVDDIFIPVETNLDITLPCYCYLENYGYKNVVSYDKYGGIIKLSSAFDAYPEVGDTILITKKKTSVLPSPDDNYVFIEPENDNIHAYNFKVNISDTDYVYCYYIKIGSAWRAITNYAIKSGTLYIETAFANEIEVGTPYEIYCNFVETPYYYFTTKATPVIVPSATFVNECIKCTATLNKFYSIRYYYWNIFRGGVLVDTSEKIESGQLEYWFREMQSGYNYSATITIVTNDGVEITSSAATCTMPSGTNVLSNLACEYDSAKNANHITWTTNYAPTSYMIMRQDVGEQSPHYLSTILSSATEYYDYTACSGQGYIYYVTPKTSTVCYGTQYVAHITPDFDKWSIYFLTESKYTKPSSTITDTKLFYTTMYGDKQYKVSKIYLPELNVECGDITHNISREVLNGYSEKPTTIVGEQEYVTFSLSFLFGNMNCSIHDISGNFQTDLDTWKDWINTGKPVLIKDIKGNCWFGTISSNSFKIDYTIKPMPYTVTVDFTETRNMDKTRILTN